MAKFVKRPIVIEAVQFTGDNWNEMAHFCKTHRDSGNEWDIGTFNPIGTYYPKFPESPEFLAELWVAANHQWLPIEVGEWVIEDSLGFYPCKEAKFAETYDKLEV